MAKIILRTNLANNNLITSNVTVDAVQGKTPSDAEVTISQGKLSTILDLDPRTVKKTIRSLINKELIL